MGSGRLRFLGEATSVEIFVHIVNFSSYMWNSGFNDMSMLNIFFCTYFYNEFPRWLTW